MAGLPFDQHAQGPPRRDFIDQMAGHWLAVEREVNPAFADPAVDLVGMLEIARDRVLKIYEGEVRWSEASAGDKAVWIGRPRNREVWERFGKKRKQNDESRMARENWRRQAAAAGCGRYGHDFTPNVIAGARRMVDPKKPDECTRCGLTRDQVDSAAKPEDPVEDDGFAPRPDRTIVPAPTGPRLVGYRERMWWNVYDTVTLGPKTFARAFTNANIGDFSRTNMDVGGQFAQESSFVAMDLYVIPCLPAHEVPWNRVLGQLIVGNKLATPKLPLCELFMGTGDGWELRPYVIPVRQVFHVELSLDEPMEPFDLVVHLEGLLTRDVL